MRMLRLRYADFGRSAAHSLGCVGVHFDAPTPAGAAGPPKPCGRRRAGREVLDSEAGYETEYRATGSGNTWGIQNGSGSFNASRIIGGSNRFGRIRSG